MNPSSSPGHPPSSASAWNTASGTRPRPRRALRLSATARARPTRLAASSQHQAQTGKESGDANDAANPGKGKSSAGTRRRVPGSPLSALLLPSLLLCMALGGCAGEPGRGRDLPPEWRGRDLAEPGWESVTLRGGWGSALEYVWSSGTDVRWDWLVNGSSVLHFKVVRIEDGQARTLLSQFSDESASGFTVPQAGQYQILWRNEGSLDISFWHRLPEGGLPRSYSPAEGPDCTALLRAPC
jgi:hypothetical protein